MWTDLHVSDELRALWLDRVAAARSPLPDAQPETRSAEHTRAAADGKGDESGHECGASDRNASHGAHWQSCRPFLVAFLLAHGILLLQLPIVVDDSGRLPDFRR